MPPIWYVPLSEVNGEMLQPAELQTRCQYKGTAHYWNVVTDTRTHGALVWGYPDPIGAVAELAGYVAFAPWDPAVSTAVDGIDQHVGLPDPSWSNPSSHVGATPG